ncbi:MAG: hypothetical protein MI922_22655 [Bacteroidales bacterium]|nr:hypothetical protein [Bacteroidales bacterium]
MKTGEYANYTLKSIWILSDTLAGFRWFGAQTEDFIHCYEGFLPSAELTELSDYISRRDKI